MICYDVDEFAIELIASQRTNYNLLNPLDANESSLEDKIEFVITVSA